MVDVVTTTSLNMSNWATRSLDAYLEPLVSTVASATGFGFTSNNLGGFSSVTGSGSDFAFSEPYSDSSSFTRELIDGIISSLTFSFATYGQFYGLTSSGSTTFSNLNLSVTTAFQLGYLSTLLDGNDNIKMSIADVSYGPDRVISSINIFAGSGDDVVIDEMASSTITPTLPGNPFNLINLGTGNDQVQISNNNRSFEITTGEGSDTIIVNRGNGALPSVRDITVTDFNVTLDEFRITGQGASGARLQDVAGGVNILTGAGYVIAFLQNVTAAQLSIVNGVVTGSVDSNLGTASDDILYGTSGADDISGLGGNDQIFAGTGDDKIDGGAGNDLLYGDDGIDVIYGGDGDDTLLPGYSGIYPSNMYFDSVNGGAGLDTISYANMTASIFVNLTTGIASIGSASAPSAARFVSIENATGGSGNDTITGDALANTLIGGGGNDIINGLGGNDTLYGEAGNDWLFGGEGNDAIYGGTGNDILRGDNGSDYLDGGAGYDQAQYTTSAIGVTVDLRWGTTSVGDTLISIENLTGSSYNDVLIGSSAANSINGGAGHDVVWGLAGNDRIEGAAGNDVLRGNEGDDVIGGGDGNDAIFGDIGNDTLYGGNGNDQINAGDGNDVIWGDAGDDYIDAGSGNDFVVLGAGDDGFTLGAGADRIRFDYGNGQDTIFDFGNGLDVLDFSATGMTLEVLQANAVETSQGVLLNLGSGSVLLAGLALYQLEWNTDFAFAA